MKKAVFFCGIGTAFRLEKQVVDVLHKESLGSEFFGCLGKVFASKFQHIQQILPLISDYPHLQFIHSSVIHIHLGFSELKPVTIFFQFQLEF